MIFFLSVRCGIRLLYALIVNVLLVMSTRPWKRLVTFDYHLDQEKEGKQLSKARLTLLQTPAEMTFTHS